MPELAISAEKVGFLIEKMREFDVKEGVSDPDSGSNGADDNMIDVLEDDGGDPVVREITGFINAMTDDEQIDLVALMRLGRGDGSRPPRATTSAPRAICSANPWSAITSPRGWMRSVRPGPTNGSRRCDGTRDEVFVRCCGMGGALR
jgi:Protein of unknown function (DUF3775)